LLGLNLFSSGFSFFGFGAFDESVEGVVVVEVARNLQLFRLLPQTISKHVVHICRAKFLLFVDTLVDVLADFLSDETFIKDIYDRWSILRFNTQHFSNQISQLLAVNLV